MIWPWLEIKKLKKELENSIKKQESLFNYFEKNKKKEMYFQDFCFKSVDSVISIEYDQSQLQCIICYTLSYTDAESGILSTYHEWYCHCIPEQYINLYNKYLKFKRRDEEII